MTVPPVPVISSCRTCNLRKQNSFCNLPIEALVELDRIKKPRMFSAGDRLFDEGQPLSEVLIVCEGTVALSFSSSYGSPALLRLSDAGEVLGLSAALSGHSHELRAEALDMTRVAAINRSDFLQLLQRFPSAALNASRELSHTLNRAYEKIRLLGSGFSVPQRLAGWLLLMQQNRASPAGPLKIALTHERIAQLLGASRESITRALSNLRRHGALEVRGIHVYVHDDSYLRSLVSDPKRVC